MLDIFNLVKDIIPASLIPQDLHGIKLFFISLGGLSLLNLWCFIDIIGFLISLYLVKYTDVEAKYPKWKKFIAFFKNQTYFFIGLQIVYIFLNLK